MPGGLWRVPSFTLAVFPFLISTTASPAPSLQPTLRRWRSLPARHRCLLISVKMFSLHSQVKLKFSPSFAVHPCVPKFFQTLFKIRISISPRRAVFLPSNPPPPRTRWPAVFLTNSFLLAIMHASYIYMRPGDLTEYVNTTFNLYFLIIFSLIFLISLRAGGGVHPHRPTPSAPRAPPPPQPPSTRPWDARFRCTYTLYTPRADRAF